MVTPFPLYDELAKMDPDILIDNKIICRTITNLDKDHAEIIYALMVHHFVLTTGNVPSSTICGGTVFSGGKGIKVLWINMPHKLQKIIAHYINTNSSKRGENPKPVDY